ncbi:MAG: hypothetical protein LBC76_03090 [Treponema sp.]|jgi:hypothetical protein|nr:hypothetical protein [Treponema sp.]
MNYFNHCKSVEENKKTIPPEVAALIPCDQLYVTKRKIREFQECNKHLETALKKCPKIGATDGLAEHPAVFHYFYGGTDIYICEYESSDGQMFGYSILNGDLQNSEWGYFNVMDFSQSRYFNIDYHFREQTIEAALYSSYPYYFKNLNL